MKESPILRALLDYGKLINLFIYRRNVAAVVIEKRFFRDGEAGQSDLYGVDMWGRHFECEVKAPGGRLSDTQKCWLVHCEAKRCHTAVVDNVEDGTRFLNLMRHGNGDMVVQWGGGVNRFNVQAEK